MGRGEHKTNGGGSAGPRLDIPMAPTLRPTKEEFKNPLQYIRGIRNQGYHKYGIVKIVPPEGWRPPFAINKETFKFSTRVQSINELQRRHIIAAKSQAFSRKLDAFHRSRGQKPPKMPIMYGQKINVFKLYCAVLKRGGYESVTQNKKWKEVGKLVCSKHKQITNLSFLVRVAYERSLLDFETYVEECCEYLKQDTSHLDALSHVCVSGDRVEEKPSNGDSVLVKVEAEELTGSPMKRPRLDGQGEDTELEALDGLIGLTTTANGSHPMPVKEEEEAGYELEEAGEEKVKVQSKVEMISDVNGMDMDFIDHMLPKGAADNEESLNLDEVFCELCGGGAHEDQIILCDKCDKGFHTFCLAPPLESIPTGDWCCPHCITSATDDLAFTEGSDFTVEEFQKMDKQFQTTWFSSKGIANKPTWWEVEDEFWDIVENSDEPCEVFYGADLDSGKLGSGFPHERHGFTGQYAESPWNLNNLPKLGGKYCSMLRHVTDNINGVIVPWVYMGMTFSSFCWHVEDHMFYSINYNHVGNPKVWYGVPSNSALAFEDVFRNYMPEQFKLQPDLLFQLVTMLSPRILKSASVPVYRAVQEEGSFVITFPRAYHGGFNSGFNCAEAVNFAPADWFDYDQDSIERYREYRRNPVLSHEALLCKVCEVDESPVTAASIHVHLKEMILKEAALRQDGLLYAKTFKKVSCTSCNPGSGFGDDDAECSICKQYMHLSACTCKCTPGYSVCLEDVERMCSCDPSDRTFVYRRTMAELEDMYASVLSRLEGCDVKKKMSEEFGKYVSESPRRVREAEMWSKAARDMLRKGNASKRGVEEHIEDADKFLWGGHAMDEVRNLVGELNGVLEWGREISRCLSSARRGRKLDFVKTNELMSASPKPLDVDLGRLEVWVSDSNSLSERAKAALDPEEGKELAFQEVQELLKACNRCPVIPCLLGDLSAAVNTVEEWCGEVDEFLRQKAKPPFSALTSLSKRGLAKLPDWTVLEKDRLAEALYDVEAFEKEAEATTGGRAPTVEDLERLAKAGRALPVMVPSYAEVQRRLEEVRGWLEEVNDVPVEDEEEEGATTELVEDLQESKRSLRSLEERLSQREVRVKALRQHIRRGERIPCDLAGRIEVLRSQLGGLEEGMTKLEERVRNLRRWVREKERERKELERMEREREWERKVDECIMGELHTGKWDEASELLEQGMKASYDKVRLSELVAKIRALVSSLISFGRKFYFFPTRSWGAKKGVRAKRTARRSSRMRTRLRFNNTSGCEFYVSRRVRQQFAIDVQRELTPLVEFEMDWTSWKLLL